jgi:cytochrome P450
MPEELSTPEAWLCPYDWYAQMRETDPIRYDDSRDVWDLFGYADIDEVLDDTETFSSDPTVAADVDLPPEDERSPVFETMLLSDPPDHDRLRGVVEDWFRPRALAERQSRIETIAENLVDDVIEAGEMDLIDEFAAPLPIIVIAELLGVPSEDRAQFRRWSETLIETPVDRSEAALEEFRQRQERATDDLIEYFETKLDERRADPREDLLSVIIHAEDEGETLSHEEAVGLCLLLLVAGNITTTNLIGNAMRCLTAHPDELARLDGDLNLLPTAIEEVLRYRSPVQALARVATRDAEIDGHQIDRGDLITLWLGSANRDPEAFEAPEAFRVDRTPNPHLGFGRGTHYCMGAPLARLEANVGLTELFSRVTDIERAPTELEPVRSAFIYGVRSFPVTFTPREPTAPSEPTGAEE